MEIAAAALMVDLIILIFALIKKSWKIIGKKNDANLKLVIFMRSWKKKLSDIFNYFFVLFLWNQIL